MNWKRAVLGGVMLASAFLTACASPGYVAYRVPGPPAPRVVGAMGYAPGPGYVWADGFWDLHGSRWAWVSGEWRRPPHTHAVWVRPYWESRGSSWRFHRGYWR